MKKNLNPLIVDTNVFIRFFVKDDLHHLQAKKFFIQTIQANQLIYLDHVVLAEIIWVLTAFYKQPKSLVINQLINFIANKNIVLENKNLVALALSCYNTSNLSYVDCWLKTLAEHQNSKLITLDKKLKKASE